VEGIHRLAGTGQKTLERINALLRDIERNPVEGIGKPESLRGDLSGW
jgi:toxin YoeB